MINRNNLAKAIAEDEGNKVQVNIGQIKEVMRCLFVKLSQFSDAEILSLVNRIRKG